MSSTLSVLRRELTSCSLTITNPLLLLLNSHSHTLSASSFHDHAAADDDKDGEVANRAVSILKYQRSKSRWSALESLFPRGLSSPQVSQILLHFRNNPHLAHTFFLFTSHPRFPSPSLSSYATIIHILARARHKTRAHSLIKDALRHNTSHPPSHLFNQLVKTYRLSDSAPFVFDLFLLSLLDLHHFDSSLRILRVLLSRGNRLCVATYNTFISTASPLKGPFFAYDLYKEIFQLGGVSTVLPNVHTFNHLLLSFHKNGVLDMVEQVWIEMAKWDCAPNCFTYCILMEAYCQADDIPNAEKVWDELTSKEGVQPDVVAYDTLIGGYCKSGRVDKAEELYKQMGLAVVEPSCLTYQHLVNGYCLAGDADTTLLLCKDMRRKGYRPNTSTVTAMVALLCDKGRVAEAFGFFTTVMGDADFVATQTTYEQLLKGLCGIGEMDEALKLQAQMVGKGFQPNAEVYGAFINGYMSQGKPDVAKRLRKELLGMQRGRVETN